MLGDAEASWLGEPEKGVASYEQALELAERAGDKPAQAEALQGLYLAHLRHGDFGKARERAAQAARLLVGSDDWQGRGIARAAEDVAELVDGQWQPGQPGGYALGVFPLQRVEGGWSWTKPEGVRNVSWGCPDFATTFAHLWRLGTLLTSDPQVGEMWGIPFSGAGLWGPVQGFLVLDAELKTIRGISFYRHEETPGLGGEISKEWFQKKFEGKVFELPDGTVGIHIARRAKADKPWEVDTITGATMTIDKVERMVNDVLQRIVKERQSHGR